MIYDMYSIYDKKAHCYNFPFVCENQDVAIRNFYFIVANDKMMSKFQDDFDLYKLGTFDNDKGCFVSATPDFVFAGHDLPTDKISDNIKA